LGIRLMAGQHTLDVFVEVRILHPQPHANARRARAFRFKPCR
jgi:hypothetical protein